MNIHEAIEIVESKSRGRTRWEGMESFLDEVLVAEIYRLREELCMAYNEVNDLKHNGFRGY